jgi:hypothetical protein
MLWVISFISRRTTSVPWTTLSNLSKINRNCIDSLIQQRYGDRHLSLVKTYNLMGVIQHTIEEPTHAIEYYE